MVKRIEKLTGADARYGWRFGCDDFLSAKQAAKELGISKSRLFEWLKDEGRKTPGHPAYPLRAIKTHIWRGKVAPWKVCARSVSTHKEIHQTAEV